MIKQKRALAIHDISCMGRCSLTVALPLLSAAGVETAILPTAMLSTHTGGFTGFTYRDLTEDLLPIIEHWRSLGTQFDAVYSGFLGSYRQADIIAEVLSDFRSQNNMILVDPVMGDNGQLYSVYSPDIVRGMKRLCNKADIILPNLTEAALLLDRPYLTQGYSETDIIETLKALAELGSPQVILTGVSYDAAQIGAVTYDVHTGEMSYTYGPKVAGMFHGTGDVFASTVTAGLLNGLTLERATQFSVDFTRKCIERTVQLEQEPRYGVCFELEIGSLLEGILRYGGTVDANLNS